MAKRRSLSEQIEEAKRRPANQSPTQIGTALPKPKAKPRRKPYRFPGIQQNYDAGFKTNAKTNERYETFTRPDKPGMTYHEYVDAEGNRRVVGVKRKPKTTGPPKGLPPGG